MKRSGPVKVKRILVADDEPSLRRLVQYALAQEGHDVTIVEDGIRALEAARTGKFDAVVLDVEMPNMDGFEVLRYLRTEEETSHLFVVMLTSQGSDDHILQGYSEGANAYLTKPLQPETLLGLLRD